MGFEHKEGSATLFVNDKKGNDKAPDWRGDGLFNGKKVKLAGWKKQGNKGGFISLTIQEDNYKKEDSQAGYGGHQKTNKVNYQAPLPKDDLESEIPW